MGSPISTGSRGVGAVAVVAITAVLALAAMASLIPSLLTDTDCTGGSPEPSHGADMTIPTDYLELYRRAGAAYAVPWTILAAIGAIESDHGRSTAPGVQTGLNAFGCCAGPMQFNLRDGPPSTWQRYRVDGNGDGILDPYAAADAIASAGNYLHGLISGAHGDVAAAIYSYNHSSAYVTEVLARSREYSASPNLATSAPDAVSCGPTAPGTITVSLQRAERIASPRAYATLPAWTMAGARSAEPIDARLLENAIWILRTYRLRVTAAREAGHNTHGDGTALDLVPADPVDQAAWDASTGALAHDLGWAPGCAASGSRPACPLAPAIQFIGYDGYAGHGSPRTCTAPCAAHLHVSWVSPCFGTSVPSPPCAWVRAFVPRSANARR